METLGPLCPGCLQRDRRIAELEGELAQVRARLEQAERASKRQAAPFSPGPPKADPKPPGRKAGATHGRHGHRPPPPPEIIDEVLEAPLPQQCECGGSIQETHVDNLFQTEIPRRVIHRQIHIHCGQCDRCGKRHRGRHPLQTSDATGAAQSQLGPDAQTAIVYLNKQAGLSYGKIVGLFDHLYNCPITRGACAQIVVRAADRLEPAYQEIRAKLAEAEQITPDETGWRIGGHPVWLHVGVGDNGATLFTIDPGRSADVLQAVIGIGWSGTLTHDGLATYERFEDALHQQCAAHALRRARNLRDHSSAAAGLFSTHVIDLFQEAFALRDQIDAGGLDPDLGPDLYEEFTDKLRTLTSRPRTNEDNDRFRRHLANHAHEWFVFLLDPSTPATNYEAEQALQTPIVNRRVWGGNRTPAGGHAQEVHSSVLRTCHKRELDAFEILRAALTGTVVSLFHPTAPTPST